MMECWIPEEEEYDGSSPWEEYENMLYRIFRNDFVYSNPVFCGLPVKTRANPRFDSKEESFWHLTCRDYGHTDGRPESRDPDLERCKRIRWPRAFIENYLECDKHDVPDSECQGVLLWESTHKPRKGKPRDRVKMFLDEEKYLLILERRNSYYQLVTAYYVDDYGSYMGVKREARRKGAKYAGSAC